MKKKTASLDMLLEESGATAIETKQESYVATEKQELKFKSGVGRPSKGKRQQFPLYLPDAVYFYLLDCVSVRKRSNRGYSMNNLIHEAINVWLKEHGAPSIEELIEKETS